METMNSDPGGRNAMKMMRMADPDSRAAAVEGRELREKYGAGPHVRPETAQVAAQVRAVLMPDGQTATEHA